MLISDLFGSINSLTWPIDLSGRIESNCWSRKCYENARKCLWWKYYLCQVILLRRGNRVLEPRNLLGVFDLRISSFIKKDPLGPIEIGEEAQFRAVARCTSFGRWTTSTTIVVLTTLLFVVYKHFFYFHNVLSGIQINPLAHGTFLHFASIPCWVKLASVVASSCMATLKNNIIVLGDTQSYFHNLLIWRSHVYTSIGKQFWKHPFILTLARGQVWRGSLSVGIHRCPASVSPV